MSNNSSSIHHKSDDHEIVSTAYFDRGYPLNIFCIKESAESLICTICLGVYHNPVTITSCGHTFCVSCLYELILKSDTSSSRCPECRSTISEVIVSFAVKSFVQNQRIRCPQRILKNLPCEWQDKLELVEAHLRYDCKEQLHRSLLKGYPRELFVELNKTNRIEQFTCKLCKGIF